MSLSAALAGLAAAAGAATVAAGALAEWRRTPLTEADLKAAPGRMVHLSAGRTHVRAWAGEGAPILCVHGLSTPSAVWGPLATHLSAAGHAVVAFDLYGRGLSDRPTRVHDARLFTRQIADLVAELDIGRPKALLGYSMGGAIAAAYADRHPEGAPPLALIAPAGFLHGLGGAYAAARVPILGDAVWSLRAGPILRAGAAAEGRAHALPDLAEIIAKETGRRGYLPALLSSYRHMLARPLTAAHRRIAARGLPVLAIWGAEDDVIPIAAKDRLAAANPAAANLVIPGAGHGLPYTHPDPIAERLCAWLTEQSGQSQGGHAAARASIASSRIGRWTSTERTPTPIPTHQTKL